MSAADPFVAEAAEDPCGLRPVPVVEPYGLLALSSWDRTIPVVPGSVTHGTELRLVAEGWLTLGEGRLVRFDADSGDVLQLFDADEGCTPSYQGFASTTDEIAIGFCRSDPDAETPPAGSGAEQEQSPNERYRTCHVSVLDADTGRPSAAWVSGIPGRPTEASAVAYDGHVLVLGLNDGPDPGLIVVFDAATGRGWLHRELADCPTIFPDPGIPGTMVVVTRCGDSDVYALYYDALTGQPVDPVQQGTTSFSITSIAGERVWLASAAAQARALPALEPLDAFTLDWEPSGELRRLPYEAETALWCCRVAVGPDAIWFQTTYSPAPPYEETEIFVGRYDLETLELLDSWIVPSSKESREPAPMMLHIVSVDRGGIWYQSGGVAYRLDV